MNLWRNNRALKTSFLYLFAFLLCTQSFAASSSSFHSCLNDVSLLPCHQEDIGLYGDCITAPHDAPKESRNHHSTPAQHPHETEVELEEKGEKEVEDDKEEMDRSAKSLTEAYLQTQIGKYLLTVSCLIAPIRAVPTPPPNA
jgi:hypothetical protein